METDLAANNDDMFGGAISELGATGMTGISRMAQNAGIVAGAKFNATEKMIRVKSVEDLVRVADEISQPVFYVESVLAENKGIAFYVFGDTTIFTYELKPVPQGVPLAQKKSGGITPAVKKKRLAWVKTLGAVVSNTESLPLTGQVKGRPLC